MMILDSEVVEHCVRIEGGTSELFSATSRGAGVGKNISAIRTSTQVVLRHTCVP